MSDSKPEQKDHEDVKAITLTPLLNDLFRPTAKLLGERLEESTRTKLSDFRQRKQEENLRYHIQKANDILASRPPSLTAPLDDAWEILNNAEKILESIDAVKDVDPADNELSSLWHHLIAELRDGKNVPQHLISALRTLSGAEAALLLQMRNVQEQSFGRRALRAILSLILPQAGLIEYESDSHFVELLQDKRLVRRTYLFVTFWLAVALLAAGIGVFVWFRPLDATERYQIGRNLFMQLPAGAFMLATVVLLNALAIGMRDGFSSYRLTWLGQELLRFAPQERPFKKDVLSD